MGRINHERNLEFKYKPEIVEAYQAQTEVFKNMCEEIGKEKGYTGINVFYVFLKLYYFEFITGIQFIAFEKKE